MLRFLALLALLLAGCTQSSGPEVVVYTALDEEFSRPIFEDFTRESGIEVRAKFDTESTKTVGLTEAIIAERDRPRCDLFWNNEILHTLRLEKLGLLEVYHPLEEEHFPAAFRSPAGTWHGFAARARVLLVNTTLVPEGERPTSIRDLADPKWKGVCGLAKPLFGTTATHAACLYAAWGPERAEQFFRDVKANARVEGGNKQVALAVAQGRLKFGLTDTDDAIIEVEMGEPVAIIYPDQGDDGLGTLFIPNTIALIKGARNKAEAEGLIDHLLSTSVEAQLAKGPSAQIPLHDKATPPARLKMPSDFRTMQVDFHQAADQWDTAAKFLHETFAAP